MSTTYKDPQRWVSTRDNSSDRRRHTEDCDHWYRHGTEVDRVNRAERLAKDPGDRVSFPRLATPEEMSSLRACASCGDVAEKPTLVTTCPKCFTVVSPSGSCLCD